MRRASRNEPSRRDHAIIPKVTHRLSLCELFGKIVCSEFGIGRRPSHRRKPSTSEPCFDLRSGEFSRSTDWSGYNKESIDAAPENPAIGRTRNGTYAK
jgi:hypothetical protein